MKYVCFFVVAAVFGAAGWLLRSGLSAEAKPDEVLEVVFPLNVKREMTEYLEAEWHYEESSTLLKLSSGKYVLVMRDDEGVITGNYTVDGIDLTDSGVEFRVKVFDLIYPEKMLEEMKKEAIAADPFGDDPFSDVSLGEDYFNERNLKGYFVIIVNDQGETFLEVRNEGWGSIAKLTRSRVFRK